ncbi:uncharacterized protein LOC126585936 isoform X2 [Malus sylvestris]|uniref:uncharacterized protein LOC126585936 isoform X2 n=1 Tax=Malus sylvestris TaxID=3752 RepID=UPI0021AD398A|nr:uncharacterized protein LOC126585936 isoform X2 [Malus sylvestris]
MEHDQDQEALFHSYPCAYYVQSPSTNSHSNSADIRNPIPESEFHSPTRPDPANPTLHEEATRFTLSHYLSSRGSSHSFLHQKKISFDARSNGTGTDNCENRLVIVKGSDDHFGDEDDDEEYYYVVGKRSGWWKRYCSYRYSDSFVWILLQISWRAMLSLCIALLVFYVVTKPPPPKVSIQALNYFIFAGYELGIRALSRIKKKHNHETQSIKPMMAGIDQFGLGEGVDGSGVTTKFLTCNCSINLIIENKSKLFSLHIRPPAMEMCFGRLPFALSHLYAESGSSKFKLYVGTRNKPVYGAGRSMDDMLKSGKGLPLVLRVKLSSSFWVVRNLIKPKFHHQAECLLVLDRAYDKKHRTQAYSSTCMMT